MGRRTQVAKGGVCKTLIQRFDSARRLHASSPSRFRSVSCYCAAILVALPVAAVARVAEVRVGVVESSDAVGRIVVVRHGESRVQYQVPTTATLLLARRPVSLDAFQKGQQVRLRCRVSSTQPLLLYDLADTDSWPWLLRMRREIVSGTVVEVTDRGVLFEDDKDHGQLAYRVTEKTRSEIVGADGGAVELKPGMKVWIAPRLLPNGTAMATAIASNRAGALRLKERSQPTVTGTVQAWDATARKLTLHTRADDTRVLELLRDCIIRRDGKDVGVASIRLGVTVTAHVRRTADAETVYRLTIQRAGRQSTGANRSARSPR